MAYKSGRKWMSIFAMNQADTTVKYGLNSDEFVRFLPPLLLPPHPTPTVPSCVLRAGFLNYIYRYLRCCLCAQFIDVPLMPWQGDRLIPSEGSSDEDPSELAIGHLTGSHEFQQYLKQRQISGGQLQTVQSRLRLYKARKHAQSKRLPTLKFTREFENGCLVPAIILPVYLTLTIYVISYS